jgi:hypothetical protein
MLDKPNAILTAYSTNASLGALQHMNSLTKVFGSNLGWDTGYPEVVHGIPQFLQTNVGVVTRLGHDHFQIFSNLLLANHPSIRRCTVLYTESDVIYKHTNLLG